MKKKVLLIQWLLESVGAAYVNKLKVLDIRKPRNLFGA